MEKIRIYELAKELNTTSKRLIEKLSEIKIDVKNHMSYLEGHEVESLYKHIGIISKEERKKSENTTNHTAFTPRSKSVAERSDTKDAPRIFRTTEVKNVDSNNDRQQNSGYKGKDNNRKNRNNQNTKDRSGYRGGRNYGGVKVTTASSGLRAGFIRDTGPIINSITKKDSNQTAAVGKDNIKPEVKTEIKPEMKAEQKAELKVDPNVELIADLRSAEAKAEPKVQAKTEPKIEPKVKTDIKAEKGTETIAKTKAEVETKIKTETKLDKKIEQKYESSTAKEKIEKSESNIKVESSGEESTITTKIKDNRAEKGANSAQPKREKNFNGNMPKKKEADQTKKWEGKPKDKREPSQKSNEKYKNDNAKPRKRNINSSTNERAPLNQKLNIPKDILEPSTEEEIRIDENKREYQNKDIDKGIKREQKREVPKSKPSSDSNKKFKQRNILLEPSKGVSQILQEDELIIDELLDVAPAQPKKSRKPSRVRKDNKGKSEASKLAVEKAVLTSVKISETITVKDLAELLKKTAADVIKKLMLMGTMVTLNQEIDFDVAAIIADEYGIKAEKEIIINEEDILFDDEEDDEDKLIARPPVVVVMGHVDHGKTSLLDAIRKTNVIESEQGGITQHIGAYTVKINDRNIAFLDTPGHEAFTSMRARGAQVTDIAILVVAADDGVMPQTVEAINHAKAAGVNIIVAINKIDKPTANPERIKQQLTEYGLVAEDWGGDIIMVPVSAKSRQNIDSLLEMVLLSADMMELKANPDKQAKGTIIESKLDKNRGPVATLLVQRGTLNVGDSIITGTIFGRIRAMNDDKGQSIKAAGPSTPVEILGLPEVPESGELFYAVKDEKLAKILADKRKQQQREEQLKSSSMVSLEDLFNQIQEGHIKELNIILKADVQGSVEALKQSVEKLTNEEVRIKVIHGGVGAITESDVKLAEVSNAIIIGFNVRPGPNVNDIAETSNVDIKLYRVIYDAINDIESAMKGMLTPKLKEVIQGHAEIRQIYKASGVGTIGGSYVIDGKISRNSSVRLLRDNIVVYEGKLASLKRFKDDAKEVSQGYECGILIEKFNDIKEGDIVEAYAMEEIEAK